MNVKYIGKYSMKLLTNWALKNQYKIINHGDILDIPDEVWNTELSTSRKWEEVKPIVEILVVEPEIEECDKCEELQELLEEIEEEVEEKKSSKKSKKNKKQEE